LEYLHETVKLKHYKSTRRHSKDTVYRCVLCVTTRCFLARVFWERNSRQHIWKLEEQKFILWCWNTSREFHSPFTADNSLLLSQPF